MKGTFRIRFFSFRTLFGISWWIMTNSSQAFSWHSLLSSTRFQQSSKRHYQSQQHQQQLDVRLRLTTLVSSVADVVHLQYMEIALSPYPYSNDPSQQQHSSSHRHVQHPPVLFLHGLLGNKKNFISLGTALAAQLETPRRILSVDLRNHGDNSHDWRDSMGHDEMALDVVALVNRLQFPQVVLVGHSMGGKVAQAMALLYPERVAGLIVLDMAPVSYVHYQNHHHHPTEDSTRDDPSVQYDSNWNTIRDILHVLTSVPLEPGMAKRDVDVFLRPHISDPAIRAFCLTNLEMVSTSAAASTKATTMPRWKIPLAKIAQQLDRLAGFDLQSSSTPSHSMFMYDGDVFFITGGQSKFVRSVHLPTIQRFFPNHMVSTIRGAGHWVHAEAPAETIALIKRYLDRTR